MKNRNEKVIKNFTSGKNFELTLRKIFIFPKIHWFPAANNEPSTNIWVCIALLTDNLIEWININYSNMD